MKNSTWIFIFLLLLAVNIAGNAVPLYWLNILSKPLLMPVLALYFFWVLKRYRSDVKKWILLALLFSWGGDVLLIFQEKQSVFFLLGLSSFLLAHIFYIVFFHKVRLQEAVKGNPWLLLIVVIYYAALISWLSPYLGEMKLPVRVYGLVISFMFMLAMHMLFLRNKMAGKRMMAGALLFVISDSLLAINKFYHSFTEAGIFIMLTYGLAQLLIVQGVIDYIRGNKDYSIN
ncbi:MAG TPA: lysoplasmalogenase [Chitinophagaceae bacterium]|nr:lysoplasmalogenase [Chitinophagaceae bacterium]